MKTVIFTKEAQEDVYNDNSVIQKIFAGERVEWKLWFNGDTRCRQTKTEIGDRFFILEEGTGIIASGTVGKIVFTPGKSRLVKCGMNHIELIPDKVGQPVLSIGQLNEIMSVVKRTNKQDELILERKTEAMKLELLWIESIFEMNASKDQLPDDIWSTERLHVQTIDAIRSYLITMKATCSCCGWEVDEKAQLFYRPTVTKSTYSSARTFKALIRQYAILCDDCASIEYKLR